MAVRVSFGVSHACNAVHEKKLRGMGGASRRVPTGPSISVPSPEQVQPGIYP